MATSKKSTGRKSNPLTSSAEGSPANLSLWQGGEEARQTSAISGLKCYALLEASDRVGSWARTFLASALTSTRYALTWRERATKSSHLRFRLRLSALPISGTDSFLWPTARAHEKSQNKNFPERGYALSMAVKLWPTPTRRDCHSRGPTEGARRSPSLDHLATGGNGGTLNPTWVEWLMGFPTGWTDLEHSETP